MESTVIQPSTFTSDMRWTWNNKLFSDLIFEVEGKTLYSHRVIVSARCPYFKRYFMFKVPPLKCCSMFESGFREAEQKKVVLEDIDFDVFLAFMRFVVSDSMDLSPQITFDLLCHVN